MQSRGSGSLIMASVVCGLLTALVAAEAQENAVRFGENQTIVVNDAALVFTSSLLPVTSDGTVEYPDDVRAQTRLLLRNLDAVLKASEVELEHVVRLHVYISREEDAETVRAELAAAFQDKREPALTLVQSAMPLPGVLVMLDAVAEESPGLREELEAADAHRRLARVKDLFQFTEGLGHAGVLTRGSSVFVSGRAAAGETLPEAVHGTMKELQEDLQRLRMNILHHTVSLKVFLNQMDATPVVAQEIAAFFKALAEQEAYAELLPAIGFAEWRQDRNTLPVEIELVACDPHPAGPDRPKVEYFGSNERFSRVARVNSDTLIFVSGVYGDAGNAEVQVRTHFTRLQTLLESVGSGLGQLVKATYYVSDPDISTQLGEQRPHLYPEGTAPAASLINVRTVARPGHTLSTDMIAVP